MSLLKCLVIAPFFNTLQFEIYFGKPLEQPWNLQSVLKRVGFWFCWLTSVFWTALLKGDKDTDISSELKFPENRLNSNLDNFGKAVLDEMRWTGVEFALFSSQNEGIENTRFLEA